jgi:hypothetical protein
MLDVVEVEMTRYTTTFFFFSLTHSESPSADASPLFSKVPSSELKQPIRSATPHHQDSDTVKPFEGGELPTLC